MSGAYALLPPLTDVALDISIVFPDPPTPGVPTTQNVAKFYWNSELFRITFIYYDSRQIVSFILYVYQGMACPFSKKFYTVS